VREIHTHRRRFFENRKRCSRRGALAQFGTHLKWLVRAWPTRNIHWLPRTERTLRRT
jgi:hypothetical protein